MFDQIVVAAIRAHARRAWPEECCGIVVRGEYCPLPNRHPRPKEHFRLEPADYIPLLCGDPIQAIVHSHVNGKDYPSVSDQEEQPKTGAAWGILLANEHHASVPFWFGDQAPIPPLRDRVFRHGVTDCYGLLRDWYRVRRKVVLPNFVRQDEWWDKGDNLFSDNFRAAGCVPIDRADLKNGDIVLGRVLSKKTNHCGIYLTGHMILHHLPKRPSRIDMLGPYERHKMITHYLRYVGC